MNKRDMRHEDLKQKAIEMVMSEYDRATSIHGPFNSAHEGHSVIREEFEELWEEVRRRDKDGNAMLKEAVHTTAMGLRFIVDICLGRGT